MTPAVFRVVHLTGPISYDEDGDEPEEPTPLCDPDTSVKVHPWDGDEGNDPWRDLGGSD